MLSINEVVLVLFDDVSNFFFVSYGRSMAQEDGETSPLYYLIR